MRHTSSLLLCLIACSVILASTASSSPKVLVLVEDQSIELSHSSFLKAVGNGYDVEVKKLSSSSLKLNDWDNWLYDKLIILASSTSEARLVSSVSEFFDAGHDVLLAFNNKASSQMKDLAQELGVSVDSSGTTVIDHFKFHKSVDTGDHTAVLSAPTPALKSIFGNSPSAAVLYKGAALSVSPSSELAMLVLTGSPTSYSGSPSKLVGDVTLAGQGVGLVAAVQGRNNARAAIAGSLDMLSDTYFSANKNNAVFAADILAWTFHQRGVLKASNLRHRIIGGEETPAVYRIKDEVEFAIDLEECEAGKCKPYRASDVQVEFVMLDPFTRTTLTDGGNGTFSGRVLVPDVYGVFKWILDYRRPGYSWIELSEQVSVRPFTHTEYERFIVQAYPYYASVVSMMVGFFGLTFLFLYGK